MVSDSEYKRIAEELEEVAREMRFNAERYELLRIQLEDELEDWLSRLAEMRESLAER